LCQRRFAAQQNHKFLSAVALKPKLEQAADNTAFSSKLRTVVTLLQTQLCMLDRLKLVACITVPGDFRAPSGALFSIT